LAPIVVTEFGIVIEVKIVRPWNALAAILVIPEEIITVLHDVIVLNAAGIILVKVPVPVIVTLFKVLQFRNTVVPIFVTEFGIVTEVRPVQFRNTLFPILVTEFGIVTEVSFVQP
jgi:hypothetical protein